MIALRPYQKDCVDAIRDAYAKAYKCPLLVLPCGAGKTVCFSYVVANAQAKNKSVLVCAHRKEIIKQISLSLARFGVAHRVIAAPSAVRDITADQFRAFGRSFVDSRSLIYVGSVQTIVKRFDTIKRAPDMVIMDEAHHVIAETQWGDVMDRYADARGLMVTATPKRLDGKGLGKGHGGYADTLIDGPTPRWLIDNGFLAEYVAFTTNAQPDLSGVRKNKKGDYEAGSLDERVNKPHLVGDAVAHWQREATGMRTVAYCVSVRHSEATAAAFNAAGISAAHFDGGTDTGDRARIVKDFAAGRIQVLCNVGLLTEGFDLASIAQTDVTIDCVIDLAPTQSLTLYIQKIMRGMRPRAGKIGVILDHAGNIARHGLPDMDREWSLDGTWKQRTGSSEPAVTIRTCPKCFAIHAPAPACPSCSYAYTTRDRAPQEVAGELVRITPEMRAQMAAQAEADRKQAKKIRITEERQCGTLAELEQLGRDRNYKFPVLWAAKRWQFIKPREAA